MDVFVTGATGVLGRPTVRRLAAAGHRVRGLSRSPRNEATLRALGAEPAPADLFDTASLRTAAEGCEAVLHLATKIPPLSRAAWPGAWAENDRIRSVGTRNLVDAARAIHATTVIYSSICFLYPDSGDTWIDASATALEPGAQHSTVDAETAVSRFTAEGGRGIILRMGSFYGPESSYTRDQLRLARWGILPVPGAPEGYSPTIWTEDAASAVVGALAGAPAGTFDVVDDEPLTHAELGAAIARAVGRRRLWRMPAAVVRLSGGPSGELLARSERVSNRRFKAATGWAPAVRDSRMGWALLAERAKAEAGAGLRRTI